MTHAQKCLACFAFLLCAAATSAFATSSAASSASDSVTTSVGSVSGSIQKSSAASSKPATPLAAGDYKIIEVATVADRPGSVRMTLQALADPSAEGEFLLFLPQEALAQSRLAQGDTVTARDRAYGWEFANSATRQAFFLVLSDDWYRELQTNAVVL